MSNAIIIICIYTFIIHLTESLVYTMRYAGIKTKQIAIALSFVTTALLVSRLSNMIQAAFLGNMVDKTVTIGGAITSATIDIASGAKLSHTLLVGEATVTVEGSGILTSANLNECSEEEFEEFRKLNIEYKTKFGFPFIIAVKGKNKNEILVNFRERIKNDLNKEFFEAKIQVKKIASFRLEDILSI